ncbi:MAG: M4 family metallopeptidase [Chitinophagales bacterium]|nr:M4 family metallopeptidase [Chitinophagales bacterium]
MKGLLIALFIIYGTSIKAQLISIEYKFHEDVTEITEENYGEKLDRLLKLDSFLSFEIDQSRSEIDELGFKHITLTQTYKSIPIEYSILKLHFKNNKLYYLNGEICQKVKQEQKAKIKKEEALKLALKYFDSSIFKLNEYATNDKGNASRYNSFDGDVVYFNSKVDSVSSNSILAYKFDVYIPEIDDRYWIFISAENGTVLNSISQSCNAWAETIYSGNQIIITSQLPSTSPPWALLGYHNINCKINTTLNFGANVLDSDNNWTAADCIPNPTINMYQPKQFMFDVHWGSMVYYDYFKVRHNRLSIDNNDGELLAWVQGSIDNAKWNGTHINIGGGFANNPYSTIDIVAHEWAHGMNSKTCKLITTGESGTINESLSDIWGACVEEYSDRNYPIPLNLKRNTWLVGEGVPKTRPSIRSMNNPNAELHPDTYNGTFWYQGTDEDKRVHINNGVMNFWFYLISMGGSGTNDHGNSYNVQRIYMSKAEKILYRAQTKYFTSTTGFLQARQLTIQAAKDLYGICSPEVKSVIDAWYAVGVGNSLIGGNSIYITDPVTYNNSDYKYAYYLVDASNIIEDNTWVTYESTNYVTLSDGFHAFRESDFSARIVPCNSSNGGMKVSAVSDNLIPEPVEKSSVDNIKFYPNPVHNLATLELNIKNEEVYIQCINMLGQIVYESVITNNLNTLDLSGLKNGQYLLRVSYNKQSKVFNIRKI